MIHALSTSAIPLNVEMLGKVLEEKEKDSAVLFYLAETAGHTFRHMTKCKYPRLGDLLGVCKRNDKTEAEAARENARRMLDRFLPKGGKINGDNSV